MDEYSVNSSRFCWGSDEIILNPEKISLLDQFAKGSILDVGSGSGAYSNYLVENGFSVSAVDSSKEFVRKSSKKYPDVDFKSCSALKLPYKKNQFDTAILFDVLEHVDDVLVLREASRVAKRVIVSVPLTNHSLLQKWSLAHHHYMDNTHKREYTMKSLRKLLKTSGYKVFYLKESLPISLKGLCIDYFSGGSLVKKLLLKIFLKPFYSRNIYSCIFAVAERKQ